MIYTKEYFEENVEEVFDAMGWKYFMEHKDWYRRYHEWCRELSVRIGIPHICVCGVFAALSPQASIRSNKIFTEAYFAGIKKHTRVQIDKADKIAAMYGIHRTHGDQVKQIGEYLNGRKTIHFFRALYNPNDSTAVCIDRHALRLAGVMSDIASPKLYDMVKEAYLAVARKHGIIASELQAATWCYWRESKWGDKINIYE